MEQGKMQDSGLKMHNAVDRSELAEKKKGWI
jgi:hypothetical protein